MTKPTKRDLLMCEVESLAIASTMASRRHLQVPAARELVQQADKLLREAERITHDELNRLDG